jgi:hypothetical protein
MTVALASVGTGREGPALLERLAPHQALFVCERRIEDAVLALSVADWSLPLRRGRMVLIVGDIPEEFARFLQRFGGYLFPGQLFVPASLDRAEAEAYSAAIERAAARAESVYEQKLREYDEALAASPRDRASGEAPRLLVLSADPLPTVADAAASLVAAGEALGWPSAQCTPNNPERASLLARLAALREHRPDLVVTLNGTLEPRCAKWINAEHAAAWFLSPNRIPAELHAGRCFAATQALADELAARGMPAERVELLGWGVDDVAGAADSAEATAPRPVQILLDGMLFDVAASAAGIGLESHQRLWEETTRAVFAAAERGEDLAMSALFEAAERRSGVKFEDRESRVRFAALAEARLGPTAAARAAEAALARQEGVELIGFGWDTLPGAAARRSAPWPALATDRASVYRRARWLIIPYVDELATRRAAEALLCGTLVLWRQPAARVLANPIGAALRKIPIYRKPADLPALLARTEPSAAACRQAADELRRAHTWRARLQQLAAACGLSPACGP